MLQSALTLMEQTANSGPLSTGLFQTHPPHPGPPVFGGLARTLFWTETASLLLPSVVAATGISALRSFAARCRRDGTALVLVGMQPAVRASLERMGVIPRDGIALADSLDAAVAHLEAVPSR